MAQVFTARTKRLGRSIYLLLPKELYALTKWRAEDVIALRLCGEKITAERVPLEKLAIPRTGEPQEVRP
ncbi:MAG TPA: hypothetical protein VE998_03465 [Terriglobales bacterium]|nr:hypothetical protein [Terriglobales bacterium]